MRTPFVSIVPLEAMVKRQMSEPLVFTQVLNPISGVTICDKNGGVREFQDCPLVVERRFLVDRVVLHW